MTSKLDLSSMYRRWVRHARWGRSTADAVQVAIGAQFEAYGQIEVDMLRFYGLREQGTLIDVGCGSGRLAIPLAKIHKGSYLGTDVVPDLLEFARGSCNRPDWRFELVDSFRIPAADQSADMVCFFSVLTHLLHEQSYIYLEEARRVLKPEGRIVFSLFIERNVIRAWADHLGLAVVDLRDGDEQFVPLSVPVTLDDGRVLAERGNLGQSICVLRKGDL